MLKTRAQSKYILNTDNQDQILVNEAGDLEVIRGHLVLQQPATDLNHAVTKAYVDSVAQGLDVKANCHVLAHDNINIAIAPATIDGHTLQNGDRIFVVGQIFKPQNGIYIFNGVGVPLTRSEDANASADITSGMLSLIHI
jgi:hypothetical protein